MTTSKPNFKKNKYININSIKLFLEKEAFPPFLYGIMAWSSIPSNLI